jgi:peptidoglycan/LPS O-acetylase OafA/YrhL
MTSAVYSSHPRQDLPSLTGLRAGAALLVFACHTAGYGGSAVGAWNGLTVGFVGVSFFFILSGVVLTWGQTTRHGVGNFYRRRFARVWPAHAVTTVAAVVLYSVILDRKPLAPALAALGLVQAWIPTETLRDAGNRPSWSLCCEAFFYAIFPLLLPWLVTRRRRIACATAIAATAMVGGAVGGLGSVGVDLAVYEHPLIRVGEFLAGVLLGLALAEGWQPRVSVRMSVALVLLVVAASEMLAYSEGWRFRRGVVDALVLVPMTLLIAAFASADLQRRPTLWSGRALIYAGQVSFCFYLVHQLVLDAAIEVLGASGLGSALLMTVVALVCSAALAVVLHHTVELPAQRRLSVRSQTRRP